jgi:hypothetical protein
MAVIIILLYKTSKFPNRCFFHYKKIFFDINRDESDLPDDSHWYKFDDTDVTDCKMDDDEELRSQCFGGDHPAPSFDQPAMKRYLSFNFFHHFVFF